MQKLPIKNEEERKPITKKKNTHRKGESQTQHSTEAEQRRHDGTERKEIEGLSMSLLSASHYSYPC